MLSSAERPLLTAKFARSKKTSPIPAYSQSTIRIRLPSSMKFAVRRSLWQGRSGTGPRARSTSTAVSRARAKAAGNGHAVARGGGGVALHDPEGVEARPDLRACVDGPERLCDAV